MRRFLVSYFLLFSISSSAHPPVGIVRDSKGNIYYTDLKQVWKVDPSTGTKIVVVPHVHTHELYMDASDNLYGEHLWYNGEKLNSWGHYVWCLKNDGSMIKIIEPTEGFRSGYSFVRDSAANMYWIETSIGTRFMKRTPKGETIKLAEEKSDHMGWLYSTPDGTLYFTEANKLKKLSPSGRIVVLTENLGSKTTAFTFAGRNYDAYGIWSDASDDIYVAMINAKKVNRITPDGRMQTILSTNSLWTACSGVFDNRGNLWLLEYSPTNECRVRKLAKEDLSIGAKPSRSRSIHLLITIATGLVVVLLCLLLRLVTHRQKFQLQKQSTPIAS